MLDWYTILVNKIDTTILLKNTIVNHEYLFYELFNKIKESRNLFLF